MLLFFRHRASEQGMYKKLGQSHETSQFSHHLGPDCQKPTPASLVTFTMCVSQKNLKRITTNQLVVLTLQIVV